MKKVYVLVILFAGSLCSYGQNNLLESLIWEEGSGPNPGYALQGDENENVREYGSDPFGNNSLLWVAKPSGNTGYDGGWKTTSITSIDHTQKYMFTIWIKKTNSHTGSTYFSSIANDDSGYSGMSLDGSSTNNGNLHFLAGDLPVLDQWVLLVGFLHGSGDSSTTHEGKIYDTNGTVLGSLTDYKMQAGTTRLRHRAFLDNDSNSADRQYYYGHGLYEVNGLEPTISELLDPSSSNNVSVSGISITPSSLSLNLGSSQNLTTTVSPSNATNQNVSWSSSNTSVATVNSNGQVTGEAAGTATITVTTVDGGFTATAQVTVSNDTPPNVTSVWSESNTTASYSGEVAIGRATVPSGYKLAVDGHIRTREIRVDQDTWPDYVFSKDYELPTLEEIQKHIEEKGHLPKMPSADEVEENGVELGNINRLLLEKIEEQMLYILQLEKRIKSLENK